MKRKLTNMLRGKERKKKYAKLNRGREEDLYTLKINFKGKRTVGKAKKGLNVEKNIIDLKVSKIISIKNRKKKERKKRKKIMENPTELQKPNIEAEVYNNNKKCD